MAPLCHPAAQTNMSKVKHFTPPPKKKKPQSGPMGTPPKPSESYSPISCSSSASSLLLWC